MASRILHAILAGINTYQSPVKPLEGCLHDVVTWKQYLEAESSFDVKITTLLNEQVTKKMLSSSIQSALTNASPVDIVFFFFSGHGTRESADPVFSRIEHDDALESFVCYDSIIQRRGVIEYDLLSDKEIHYLLSEYGKEGTHIVLIFDCCHSGGITRNALFAEKNGVCNERRYTANENGGFIAPMRRWDKFLFAEKISRDQVESFGWLNLVKQKPHIALSACQNDESAYEQNGHGVFTSNLVDVLKRTNGSVSYYGLQSRVRLFIQNQFRQTPEAYVIRHHEDDLLRTFLDKTSPHADISSTLYFKKFTGWVMDLGALHGITSYSSPVLLSINDGEIEVPIREVFSNYTLLEFPDDVKNNLDREAAYRVSVKNHFSCNTTFYFDRENDMLNILEELIAGVKKWMAERAAPFFITGERMNASYLVKTSNDKILICQNDEPERPATQILLSEAEPVARAIQYMRHIAQWDYIRTLSNPDFTGGEYPVIMTFYRVGGNLQKHELIPRGDSIEMDYEKSDEGEWTGKLKASITNRSKTKYYCSILYLSNRFQVYGNILDGKVTGLNPGETAWINNGDNLDLDLEQHIVDFNYPSSVFYFKLLAGIKPFQVETLEQSALPAPDRRNDRGGNNAASRALKTREEKPVKKLSWFTRTVCFKSRNPDYTPIKIQT